VAGGRRTLLFCTSYVENEGQWRVRARRWLDYHLGVPLERDAIFIIDDASPYLAPDPDLRVIDAIPAALDPGPAAWLYRFAQREGRTGMKGHRGWWRSFLHSLAIARALGFTRIVHVESDAYLLSRKIVDHVNALEAGWTVFWCPMYDFPEPALQVICADQFDAMAAVAARGLDQLTQGIAERTLPFTRVERSFAGNRYGERGPRIPGYADYACQVHYPEMVVRYRG